MLASKTVRILAIVVAGLVALVPAGARADQREDLQLKGEQQAKDGRYTDAIDSFKAADRIEQRASHACLIALAYTRRELWSQAQLWLSKCHDRATDRDPMPDWTPLAEKQIKDRLLTANVVEVTIVVEPSTAQAEITVSSFAPDETFAPRTIHLSPGTHVIFAKAAGFAPQQKTITLKDKTAQRVVIQLAPPAGTDGTMVQPPPEVPEKGPSAPSNTLSTALIALGGAGLIVGVGSHIVMAKRRKTLDDAPDLAAYHKAEGSFETWRAITIGSYVVGAGLAVTGYFLRKKAPSESAQLTAVPLPEGGGVVSIGWTR